eukprot:scaffold9602_cov56-Phaeocystis_antarctica.AAC.1
MAKSSKSSKPNRRCDSTEPDQARVIPVHHSAVFFCPDRDIGLQRPELPRSIKHPRRTVITLHPSPAGRLLLLSYCLLGATVADSVVVGRGV